MTAERVLIVDDEPLIRHMLRDILELAAYTVVEASDGTEGLEKAEALSPDVILLDLIMSGVVGYGVCQGLKANPTTQAIPVIFVTASQDLRFNRLAYAAGAIACLPKPFRREALIALIEATLGSAERRAHAPEESGPPKRDLRVASPLFAGD